MEELDGTLTIDLQSAMLKAIVESKESKLEYELPPSNGKSAARIGRDLSCDIVLTHRSVSRINAVITYDAIADQYVIYDGDPFGKASSNGVVLNKAKIRESALLHVGDIIQIDGYRITIAPITISPECNANSTLF